jgi:hypothetical protein
VTPASEAVGRGERARRALQAVTVGVGLHHRPDLRLAGDLTRPLEVVAKGGRPDDGADRARHGTVSIAYRSGVL